MHCVKNDINLFYIISAILIIFLILFKTFDYFYSVESLFTPSYKDLIKSDIDYKKQIIAQSGLSDLTLEDLSSIVGPYELEEFMTANSENPDIYIPSNRNIQQKIFQANFHSHTRNSDGSLTVEEMLDLAKKYAETEPVKPFYISITDHNKTISGKQIVEILNNNSEKYKNLKIVLGMEVSSILDAKIPITRTGINVHLVSLAINPYDKELNEVFYDRKFDRNNYSHRTFESAVNLLNRKGLVGIAHPARYVYSNVMMNRKIYYWLVYKKYKFLVRKSFAFTEAYYQSYSAYRFNLVALIQTFCDVYEIKKTGSIDNHGRNFFRMN